VAGTLTLTCVKPGGGAFIVDGGRPGYRALGVADGGPADVRSRNAANRILGRPRNATCLETTLLGGQWLLSGKGQITFTGADMNWRLNGQLADTYTVLYLDGDYLLTSTSARRGLRSYIAINGAWSLPNVLDSQETGGSWIPDLAEGWSTTIEWSREASFQTELEIKQHWPTLPYRLPVVPGPEWMWLSEPRRQHLLKALFTVAPTSNRQGIRLLDSTIGLIKELPNMLSSPVLPGTVQLSPSGPIVLGPDAQTIGGYPRVLLVKGPDSLAAAFQVGIGEELAFTLV